MTLGKAVTAVCVKMNATCVTQRDALSLAGVLLSAEHTVLLLIFVYMGR